MTIKTFIEKAIEGGYEWTDKPLPYPLVLKLKVFRASFKGAAKERITNRALLNPDAWRAVGKVEGWEAKCSFKPNSAVGDLTECHDGWLLNMHRMIDALAEGKTTEQYLETL